MHSKFAASFEKTALVSAGLGLASAVAKKGGKLLYRIAGGTPLAAGATILGASGDTMNTKAKFDRAYLR